MEGLGFLNMVRRKVTWLQQSSQRLVEIAEG
jgi:hypothetical protein